MLEGAEDRARTAALPGASGGEPRKGLASLTQIGDLRIERCDAGLSELASAGAVVGQAEVEQFSDFSKGEAGRLC